LDRPEFLRAVRKKTDLSEQCNIPKKWSLVTVCILFKQTVLSHFPKFKSDNILSQIWLYYEGKCALHRARSRSRDWGPYSERGARTYNGAL